MKKKAILGFMTGAAIGTAGTFAGVLLGVVVCLNIESIRGFFSWVSGTVLFDPELYFLSKLPADMNVGETVSVVVMALAIINSLKSFDIVYVMTQGGPFHSSDTLAMFMYTESFKKYYMGYGSAISVVLFAISLLIIVFYFRQVQVVDRLYD